MNCLDCLKILVLIFATTVAKKKGPKEPKLVITVLSPYMSSTADPRFRLPMPNMTAYKPCGFIVSFPHHSWMNTTAVNFEGNLNKPMNGTHGSINGPFKLEVIKGRTTWMFKNEFIRLHNNDRLNFVINVTLNNGTEHQRDIYQVYKVDIQNMIITPTQAAAIKAALNDFVKAHNKTVALDYINKLGLREFMDKNIKALIEGTSNYSTKRPTFSWDDD